MDYMGRIKSIFLLKSGTIFDILGSCVGLSSWYCILRIASGIFPYLVSIVFLNGICCCPQSLATRRGCMLQNMPEYCSNLGKPVCMSYSEFPEECLENVWNESICGLKLAETCWTISKVHGPTAITSLTMGSAAGIDKQYLSKTCQRKGQALVEKRGMPPSYWKPSLRASKRWCFTHFLVAFASCRGGAFHPHDPHGQGVIGNPPNTVIAPRQKV